VRFSCRRVLFLNAAQSLVTAPKHNHSSSKHCVTSSLNFTPPKTEATEGILERVVLQL